MEPVSRSNAKLPFWAALYTAFICVLFGSNAIAIKISVTGVGPFTFIGALAYQSLISASFGFVAWTGLLKRYGAVALHSFIFIMPVAGVSLGGLLLDEPITNKILLALALVVTGIFIVQYKEKAPGPIVHPGKNL